MQLSVMMSLARVMVIVMVVVVVEADPEPHHHHHHGGRVAALAFAGGYLAGHHGHHHHHHGHGGGGGCYNCGCGGCGGSCGWCGGSYGKRRKRRSLDGFLEDSKIKNTYEKIAAEDKDECGLRLVCELAQMDPRQLADDEVQILLPYSGSGESDGTVYGNYNEAAWHGQEGRQCHSRYPLCAFTADQIMEEYRNYQQQEKTNKE
ncbi:hypothetical protein Pmani_032367 [Petrolisthes manimaculis]|uniref:Uncharacterized protein n=1 Tax=Petrolisthes manimaculis TaxID=1843537 RepID=A0AAE1NTF8_9EUCA|nr:hypothetical protein Pmani_032367 [Petrolisthes manimaculis]